MKTLITTAFLISTLSLSAFAGGGTADTGGGNAVGNQLLDVFENEGTTAIKFTQLKAYQEVVKPLLDNVDSKVPGFTELLLSGVEGKVWLLDSKPLSRNACLNSSMIEVARDVVGCQNHLEVRLYKPWFDNVDSRQQAALIIHELVRGLALKSRDQYNMNDQDVNFVTRTILQVDQFDETQLIAIFNRTNVSRELAPYSAYVSFNQKVLLLKYRQACTVFNRTTIDIIMRDMAEMPQNSSLSETDRNILSRLNRSTATLNDDPAFLTQLICTTYKAHLAKYQ